MYPINHLDPIDPIDPMPGHATRPQVVILSNVRRFHESHRGEQRFLDAAEQLFTRRSVQQQELHPAPWALQRWRWLEVV